jgi:hypothetical protein
VFEFVHHDGELFFFEFEVFVFCADSDQFLFHDEGLAFDYSEPFDFVSEVGVAFLLEF